MQAYRRICMVNGRFTCRGAVLLIKICDDDDFELMLFIQYTIYNNRNIFKGHFTHIYRMTFFIKKNLVT